MGRRNIILSAVIFSFFMFFAGDAATASAEEKDNTICKGVFIDEVDVSGMTEEQAKEAVDQFVDGLKNKEIAIMVGENVVYSTMGELGYMAEESDGIKQAMALGKSGNLIKQYKDIKDIEQGSVVFPLSFNVDENKIKELVSEDVSAYNIKPVNAKISRENGEFKYTEHVVGSKVNVDKTADKVKESVMNWNRQDLIVDAVVEDDMPEYTKEDVEKCKDLLGEYTTDFSTSSNDRAGNVSNGAKLINNTVLYPGDTFSAYKVLTPFTKENGYFVAGAYLQGKVIDSVGGGACQVTTTLYNAVLQSELEIVERQPHSMTISYVALSRDAAIAGTYKDFKFKNDTDYPILIEGMTRGRKITFKVWGQENRDMKKRKIDFVTVVLSETPPPKDKITKDPTQPTSYKKVTQSAHTGYKAELYKVVYENGIEVSRTLVNKSNYSAAPKYITVGTKKEEDADKDAKKDSKKDSAKKTSGDAVIAEDPLEEFFPEETEEEEYEDEYEDEDGTENQSLKSSNLTNPNGQIQADIWNEE
jgi:vancomycin resistance protein YoaR